MKNIETIRKDIQLANDSCVKKYKSLHYSDYHGGRFFVDYISVSKDNYRIIESKIPGRNSSHIISG